MNPSLILITSDKVRHVLQKQLNLSCIYFSNGHHEQPVQQHKPKSRLNPSKLQVGFQIGCPALTIFSPPHSLPPSHSLPRIPAWWQLSVEIGPLLVEGNTEYMLWGRASVCEWDLSKRWERSWSNLGRVGTFFLSEWSGSQLARVVRCSKLL